MKGLNPTFTRGREPLSDETIVISPEPNIRLTQDHPVNSYLSRNEEAGKTTDIGSY